MLRSKKVRVATRLPYQQWPARRLTTQMPTDFGLSILAHLASTGGEYLPAESRRREMIKPISEHIKYLISILETTA
jgi:hypothetical protein